MKGYVQIYTGNGKGKTTCSLGLIMRASGHNFKIFFMQFIKGRDYGELHSLSKLENVTVERFGTTSFIHKKENIKQIDIDRAREGIKRAKEVVFSGKYDLVILDEICVANKFDLVSTEEVLDLIKNKPEHVELVLTGRNAKPELIEAADLVTEMTEIKHYFKQGVMAREGIEK